MGANCYYIFCFALKTNERELSSLCWRDTPVHGYPPTCRAQLRVWNAARLPCSALRALRRQLAVGSSFEGRILAEHAK